MRPFLPGNLKLGILTIIMSIGSIPFSSCTKEYSLETRGLLSPKDAFEKYLLDSKSFVLSAFYSDAPVDYDPLDTIGPTKDLWQFVRGYLKDDTLVFQPNNVANIVQGSYLIYPGSTATFNVDYAVSTDTTGHVLFDFVDFEYQPITYHLQSYNDTSFLVSVDTLGVTLYTRYRRIF